MTNNIISQDYRAFLENLKSRVASSRYKAAFSVNRELILLYHHIGSAILKSQEDMAGEPRLLTNLAGIFNQHSQK